MLLSLLRTFPTIRNEKTHSSSDLSTEAFTNHDELTCSAAATTILSPLSQTGQEADTIAATTFESNEIGSVMVMDTRTYQTMRFGYTATTTLAQFRQSIRRDLFHHSTTTSATPSSTTTLSSSLSSSTATTAAFDHMDARRCYDDSLSSLHVDGNLQLFWLGKELKEGCSWHTVGIIDEEDVVLMKDLDFGNMFVDSISSRTLAAAERPIMHAHFIAPPSAEASFDDELDH